MIFQFDDIIKEHGNDGVVELEADIVVVGTGAGGAPLSYELAKEGYSVIMLEEGGYHDSKDFCKFNAAWSSNHLYRDKGMVFSLGIPVALAPVGRTVGGTTTINQGTSLRLPNSTLKTWQLEYGLTDISDDEMSLLYSAVEEFIFVKKADPEVAGKNASKFIEGARKLGLTAGYLPRNAKDCEGYGFCSFGCPSGAKQSMDKSYIPEAMKYKADVYADCHVQNIMMENGRATGLSGVFQDHYTGELGPEVHVHGKVTVLSGGSVGTPLLLMANKLCNSSGQVGKNYRMHPSIHTIPIFDEVINPHEGISQSAEVTDFMDAGFVLETTVLPPDMLAMCSPGAGKFHSDLMLQYPNSGFFASMLKDSSSGRIVPLDRQGKKFQIFYQMNKEDMHNVKLSVVTLVEMAFAAGAKKIYTVVAGYELIESHKDLERLRRAKIKGKHILAVSGWHPMGTCRMGIDPESSVVNQSLETWDVPDLFIVDGSVFPTALGVNPQITIMALSMRAAGLIDDRLSEKGIRPQKKPVEKPKVA